MRTPRSLYRPLLYIDSVLPLAEKALIKRIRQQARMGRALHILAGIGDDCAVLRLPPRHEALITTDFSLEGIHFRRDWHPPEVIGHRCLTRGLSDIAAMGGEPIAAFLSLALPRKFRQSWVDRFLRGLLQLANDFGVTLAGGDTAESRDGILADIVVLGSVPKSKAILRSGARPGDHVYVSGQLGGSAATIELLLHSPSKKLHPTAFSRHFYPIPRIKLGRILGEKGFASAMIDLSDGLSTDLAHICDESGVGAEIRSEAIPRATMGKPPREVELRFALHGGEDYELLFTVPRTRRIPETISGVPITLIGEITKRKGVILIDENSVGRDLLPEGWEHFRV